MNPMKYEALKMILRKGASLDIASNDHGATIYNQTTRMKTRIVGTTLEIATAKGDELSIRIINKEIDKRNNRGAGNHLDAKLEGLMHNKILVGENLNSPVFDA